MHISTGKFSQKSCAMTFRKAFIQRWQRFCHANYTCPKHLQKDYGVDRTTAENWWNGRNAPQGWAVGRAFTDPNLQRSALHHIAAE